MHNFNQLQPAPYDGMYRFPSIIGRKSADRRARWRRIGQRHPRHAPARTAPSALPIRPTALPMLPVGKYVVEVVVPPGYELVKEEDKNILLGDSYIGPVTQQFGGLGSIFILPDQAQVGSGYNPNNPQNPTTSLGALPRHEGDTGQIESFWPCVGQARIVPDFVSLFPQSGQLAPFAGATRNLCDRKEVTLDDQSSSMVKFYVFTSTHIAGHYTGIITDDFTSEFDPFSPAFGEKFSPPEPAGSDQGLGGQRSVPRVFRPVGSLQRDEFLELRREPAGPERIRSRHDGHVHERPGSPAQRDHDRIPVQPGLQQLLLRAAVHAGADPVHGHAGHAHVGILGRLQSSGLRVPGCHAGHQLEWMATESDRG